MPISRLADASALLVYQQMRPPPVQALSPISLLWFILSSVLYDAPHSWIQMQQTCLAYCFRQSCTFFITIKKVCAHDNKGFTSRQKRFTLTMKKLAVGLCGLAIKTFSL